MTFISGTKLGTYEIIGPLGAGGMGEVYRARDARLKREVAIKVLPDGFARDADRITRFQREAEALAALNHPHIAGIYDLAEIGDSRLLILELVEGETLADRIARGPLPIDETLDVAKQIAEALAAAHEKGIVHRDLKPANIKFTGDGSVKVLDFGLAKALTNEGANTDLSHSPTLSIVATNAGMILGTASYMSPEQARGRPVDRRTDIFAFGCVLYEMLTGKRAFDGEDIAEILGAVLKTQPDWSLLPPGTPPGIQKLLRRCLEKSANSRRADAADIRMDIEDALTERAIQPTPPHASRHGLLPWASAVLVALGVTVTLSVLYFRAPAETPEIRTDIVTPSTLDPISFAISPDAKRLVFVASGNGESRLWLRSLDAVTTQPLAGTEGAMYPFWSPDSRSIGFFAGGNLKRVDIGGGLPQPLTNVGGTPRGGAWSPEGEILFAPSGAVGLFRISASGGEAVAVITKLDALPTFFHGFPQFLAGGRQFLFYVYGSANAQGIYLGSLDSPETKRLTAADAAGLLGPSGWLLFPRQGALMAQRFDRERGELSGDAVTVADSVGVDASGGAAFSISTLGPMSYRTGGITGRQLTWFDRSGKTVGTMAAPDENNLISVELSPDGRRVAVDRTVLGNRDIWLIDAARTSRFTFDASADAFPIWSRDGSRVVFDSSRKGARDLYQKPSSGGGNEEIVLESSQNKTANDLSPDGRFLLYRNTASDGGSDLWVLPMGGDRKPYSFLTTSFDERTGEFSPDGRWVAYQSNESGRFDIYVRPFLGPGGQWQVSTAGGIQPRWRPDGKELYYIAPDGKLMAASIALNGTALEPATPTTLFQTRIWGGGSNAANKQQYDVAPDGRFLMNVTTDDALSPPITLLQNWHPPAK
jgi:eukaryotic-like serine/threonine-protein kinase